MIKMSKTKLDAAYTWLLQTNTATIQEITTKFNPNEEKTNKYTYDKIITPLLKSNKLERIRRGLYTAIDPITNRPIADPVIVASKLRTPYYLGYYTALTLYGSAYSARSQAHVCIQPENRFREFTYNGTTYTPIYTQDTETNIQTINYRGHEVDVCGKERLLVELVENPQYIGGWEQTLKSLETLGGIEYMMIPEILEKKNVQILTRKTGYVLTLLKKHSIYHKHLPEQVTQTIQNMVQGQPEYLEKNKKGELDNQWRLYVPPDFTDYLRGI
jgi:predicted transcriptional regulator of viral defense system